MSRSIYELPEPTPRSEGAGEVRLAGGPEADRVPIGLIYNPRSHRNRGKDLDLGGREDVLVAAPQTRGQIVHALEDFAARGVELVIINGGDGTVRDVLTCGHDVFGDQWPAIAVLPKGKTNALNVDLGAPSDWTAAQAADAFATGRRVVRRPLAVTPLDGEGRKVLGFILGAGAFTLGTDAGQDAHRMGLFDSLAVGMTTGWGVLQALFGRDDNPWRRGVGMRLRLMPDGRELDHSGHGDPARREIILASTLHRMPFGLKVFGRLKDGLKMAVLDRPRRRVVSALPLILAGWQPRWLRKAGLHQLRCEAFEFAIEDQFILDGEHFPAGRYCVEQGPELTFVTV